MQRLVDGIEGKFIALQQHQGLGPLAEHPAAKGRSNRSPRPRYQHGLPLHRSLQQLGDRH